jgi:hypothetical protein
MVVAAVLESATRASKYNNASRGSNLYLFDEE